MKVLALLCVVVVVAEARPQDIQSQAVDPIAAEFEKFHQLWLAEAQRNSVAPVSPYKTTSQAKEAGIEAESAKPQPQPEPEFKTVEPIQEPTGAETAEAKPAEAAPEIPDMNAAFANFHALWEAEAARNAIAPMAGATASEPLTANTQEVAQPVAEVKQEVVPQDAPVEAAPAATPDFQTELEAFQQLWQQEAARNAIAPTFDPQQVAAAAAVEVPAAAAAVEPPVAAPMAAEPAALASEGAAAPAIIPTNLLGNVAGSQPLIIVLPNWPVSTAP